MKSSVPCGARCGVQKKPGARFRSSVRRRRCGSDPKTEQSRNEGNRILSSGNLPLRTRSPHCPYNICAMTAKNTARERKGLCAHAHWEACTCALAASPQMSDRAHDAAAHDSYRESWPLGDGGSHRTAPVRSAPPPRKLCIVNAPGALAWPTLLRLCFPPLWRCLRCSLTLQRRLRLYRCLKHKRGATQRMADRSAIRHGRPVGHLGRPHRPLVARSTSPPSPSLDQLTLKNHATNHDRQWGRPRPLTARSSARMLRCTGELLLEDARARSDLRYSRPPLATIGSDSGETSKLCHPPERTA